MHRLRRDINTSNCGSASFPRLMWTPRLHCCNAVLVLILVLMFSAAPISIAYAKDSASIEQNLMEANGYYNKGNLDQALLLYRRCLEQDPNQSDCLCNLGSLLVDRGHTEEAETHYRRALEVTDSKHAGALYNLALLLQDSQKEEDLMDAKNLYLKLINIEPDNAEAWANIGAVLHQLGDLNLAIRSYMKAIELYSIASDVTDNGSYLSLSSLYEKVGRATLRLSERIAEDSDTKSDLAAKAIGYLRKAVSYNPENEVRY